MSFSTGLKRLSRQEQKQLPAILQEWRHSDPQGNILVDNLENEVFLPQGYMQHLLKDIVWFYNKHKGKTGKKKEIFVNLKRDLSQEFYNKYQRRGGEMMGRLPELVGTVLPWERFVNHILVHTGYPFSAEKDVWNALRDLKRYNYLHPALEGSLIKIADWLVWFTWNEKDRKSNPFSFVRYGREELTTALGLGGKPYRKKLISFVFLFYLSAREGAKLYKPTFSDADFSLYFHPASGGDYGWTKPLNHGWLKNGERTAGRPEAVEKSYFFPLNKLYTFNHYP